MKNTLLRISLLLAVLLGVSLPAFALPARPGKTVYVQPDGSRIVLQKHGDEWSHWVTDEDGRVMKLDADGFYRPTGEDPALRAQAASIRRRARRSMQAGAASAGHVAQGQKHFLVILVQFQDVKFSYSQSEFHNLLNQAGYNKNGATGSARDFYYQNSNSFFEPIFDVYGPVTLEHDVAYYGGNDSNGDDKAPEDAVAEGCKALNGQVDFSLFDNDDDGDVDLVFMFYAGYGEADTYGNEDTIWPHQWELSEVGKAFTLDGKKIDKYACANEIAGGGSLAGKLDGIGAVCHEFGHAMGLPDFYDSDYDTNGLAGGLYDVSVMCEGCYNNDSRTPPYFNMEERILLGWVSEAEAYQSFGKSGSYTIPAIRPENDMLVAYKTETDMDGEYFVYECRGDSGWDKYISGHGLVVYQVDKSSRKVSIKTYAGTKSLSAASLWYDWEDYNSINENGSHPCFRVVPAASQSSNNYTGSYSKIPFPGSGNVKTYTATSWNKVEGAYALSDISYSAGQSSFTLTNSSSASGLDYFAIANPGNGKYSKNGSFALELLEPEGLEAVSVAWTYDGNAVSESSVTLSSTGVHVVEATVTLQGGRKDVVTLEITVQ